MAKGVGSTQVSSLIPNISFQILLFFSLNIELFPTSVFSTHSRPAPTFCSLSAHSIGLHTVPEITSLVSKAEKGQVSAVGSTFQPLSC